MESAEAWVAVPAKEFKRYQTVFEQFHAEKRAHNSHHQSQEGHGMQHSSLDINIPVPKGLTDGEVFNQPPPASNTPALEDSLTDEIVQKHTLLHGLSGHTRSKLEHILNFISKTPEIEYAPTGAIKINGQVTDVTIRDIAPHYYDRSAPLPHDYSKLLTKLNAFIREDKLSEDQHDELRVTTGQEGAGHKKTPWYYIGD